MEDTQVAKTKHFILLSHLVHAVSLSERHAQMQHLAINLHLEAALRDVDLEVATRYHEINLM